MVNCNDIFHPHCTEAWWSLSDALIMESLENKGAEKSSNKSSTTSSCPCSSLSAIIFVFAQKLPSHLFWDEVVNSFPIVLLFFSYTSPIEIHYVCTHLSTDTSHSSKKKHIASEIEKKKKKSLLVKREIISDASWNHRTNPIHLIHRSIEILVLLK